MNNRGDGVYVIILASGQSKRMGKPKLLLPWKGISLIEHILMHTEEIPLSGVHVVIPEHNYELFDAVIPYSCKPIRNNNSQQGMGYSLSLGIASLPSSAEAAIILLGDQPQITKDDIQKVLLAFEQMKLRQNSCPRSIIQMCYENNQAGHPTLFSKHFFEDLRCLKSDKGGRDIIRENRDCLFLCYTERKYPRDIDTPDDYAQLINEG